MIKILSKTLVGIFLYSSLYAGEFQYGNGTLDMTGGFMGLDETISADISTYSLIEKHKNIFSSSWYYKYNFTWYDSDTMVQAQDTINGYISNANNILGGILGNGSRVAIPVIPSIDYRLQGLDLNLVLGKDLYHKGENDYFGLGVLVGVSLPWIESEKSSDNDDSTSDNAMNLMQESKTKMMTYKIGPSIAASVSFNKYIMLYGSACYAYQTGTLKNDYAQSDLKVDGIFQEYDAGIKFVPFAQDYKTKYITLSPRLYASLGYRYTNWTLNDIAIDVTGLGHTFTQTDFTSSNSVLYFGIGYDFF